nr:uncharacterized protein LOC110357483 isoform X2 [Columba livia]
MTMQKNGSNEKHRTFLLLSSVEKKLWIPEFYSGFCWFSGVLPARRVLSKRNSWNHVVVVDQASGPIPAISHIFPSKQRWPGARGGSVQTEPMCRRSSYRLSDSACEEKMSRDGQRSQQPVLVTSPVAGAANPAPRSIRTACTAPAPPPCTTPGRHSAAAAGMKILAGNSHTIPNPCAFLALRPGVCNDGDLTEYQHLHRARKQFPHQNSHQTISACEITSGP